MPSVSMCYGCEFRWWYMQSEWRHAFGVSCLLDCGFFGGLLELHFRGHFGSSSLLQTEARGSLAR